MFIRHDVLTVFVNGEKMIENIFRKKLSLCIDKHICRICVFAALCGKTIYGQLWKCLLTTILLDKGSD